MNDSKKLQHLQQICHIYSLRSDLDKRRNSLRHKCRYLQKIKRIIQIRDNFLSSSLYGRCARTLSGYDTSLLVRAEYLKNNPLPKRFKDVSLSEINLLLLRAQRDLVDVRIKIMKHTHKYSKQLIKLCRNNWTPVYRCGTVIYIAFFWSGSKSNVPPDLIVQASDFKRYGDEFLANKEIDKILRR